MNDENKIPDNAVELRAELVISTAALIGKEDADA